MTKQNYKSADLFSRWLANAIDSGISFAILLILIYIAHFIGKFLVSTDIKGSYELIAILAVLLISLIYPLIIEPWIVARKGGSIGKLLLKLKIVKEDTKNYLSFKRSFVRSFLKFFILDVVGSFVAMVNIIMIFMDEKRQAGHDRFVDTWVVQNLNEKSLIKGVIVFILIIILNISLITGLILIISNL